MMADHFTFFASYYDSVEDLEPEIKAEFFDALFKFALRDEEPKNLHPVVNALFSLAKPNISKSKARRRAGQAGGKQSASKREAKRKQRPTDKDKDKDKEKGKRKLQKHDSFSDDEWNFLVDHRKAKKSPLTDLAVAGLVREFKKTNLTFMECLEEMALRGWVGFKAEWVKSNGNAKGSNGYVEAGKKDYRS